MSKNLCYSVLISSILYVHLYCCAQKLLKFLRKIFATLCCSEIWQAHKVLFCEDIDFHVPTTMSKNYRTPTLLRIQLPSNHIHRTHGQNGVG